MESKRATEVWLNNFASFFLGLWFGPFLALCGAGAVGFGVIPGFMSSDLPLAARVLILAIGVLVSLELLVIIGLHLKTFVLGAKDNHTFSEDLVTICVIMLGSGLVAFPFTAAIMGEKVPGNLLSFTMTFYAWIGVTACLVAASPLRHSKLLRWLEE